MAAVVASATAGPLQQLRKVALSGESPVGGANGITVGQLADTPAIDNFGNVAFSAAMDQGSVASSVWISFDGQLRLVAQSDDAAPNTGAAFAQFSDVVIADGGIVGFKATLVGNTIDDDNRESIWLDRAGTLARVEAGQKAPDPTADLRFSHFETSFALNRDGQVAFFARTREKDSGTAQSSGIWVAGSNGISLAASEGTAAITGSLRFCSYRNHSNNPLPTILYLAPPARPFFADFSLGRASTNRT